MLLPFVRELFTDVESLPGFTRVASHLKEGTGRVRVSGLTPTAKALLLVLWQRAAERPLIVVVNDNRAVEDLVPILRASRNSPRPVIRIRLFPCPPVTSFPFRISRPTPSYRKNGRRPCGRSPPVKLQSSSLRSLQPPSCSV